MAFSYTQTHACTEWIRPEERFNFIERSSSSVRVPSSNCSVLTGEVQSPEQMLLAVPRTAVDPHAAQGKLFFLMTNQ